MSTERPAVITRLLFPQSNALQLRPFSADMIGKRNVDCTTGRDWYLNLLRQRYGSGNLVEVLKYVEHYAKTLYPRKLCTERWCTFAWTDHPLTTHEEIAFVLNCACARHDSDQARRALGGVVSSHSLPLRKPS